MLTTQKTLPKSQIALTVELEPSEWQKYRTQALRRLATKVNMPGFRKGHIPEKVLLEQLSEPAIMAETIDLAIPQTYLEAVKKENIRPIAPPDVKLLSDQPFRYEAVISVLPEVRISPLKKLKLKTPAPSVETAEVDSFIEQFREQLAEQKPVTRAAKKGDVAVLDFQGFDEQGVALEGTQSKGHPVVIGSEQMIPGFEEELIGLAEGGQKSFTIRFPKDYRSSKFADKKVRFDISVHEVRERVLPEVNADFAEKLSGQKKSVDELRQEISAAVIERKTIEKRQTAENLLLEAVEKATSVDPPEVLIAEEVEYVLDTLKMKGLQQGITWENQLVHLKKSEEELKKEVRPQAERQIRARLGLQKFLETDQVTATPEEVSQEIGRTLARMSKAEQDKKGDLFKKGERGWYEAENRVRLAKWIDQKIKEYSE